MDRPPVGVVVLAPDTITFYGRRPGRLEAGQVWHDGLDGTARGLLDTTDDLRGLKWDGLTVVERTEAERVDIVGGDMRQSANESAAKVGAEAWRDIINERLVALGQPEITETELANKAYDLAAARAAKRNVR